MNETYPAVAEAVPLARRALTAVAAGAGAGGERLEEIRLAVSEALTPTAAVIGVDSKMGFQ